MKIMTAVILAILVNVTGAAVAQETLPLDEVPVSFHMTNESTPGRQSSMITFELLSGEIRSVRIYAEPSHRLLGALVNSAGGDPEQQPWYRAYSFHPSDRVAQFPITTGSKATLQAKLPADDDQTLDLVVDAVWPRENVYSERALHVAVSKLTDYEFTITRYSTLGQICCTAVCGRHCALCPREIYRCCTQNGCEWCGEPHADCEQGTCPNC